MVRTYKRKRPRPWRDKDKRMAAAVKLRAAGKSLRQIGEALGVSYQTIARDLARWDREHANVVPLSPKAVTKLPHRGEFVTSECDSGRNNVVPLERRTTA